METRQLTGAADTATAGLDDVIEVGGLRQRYGGFEAVRDVSFTVARGEIAAALHLTEGTVRNHLSAAITKLGAANRIAAIRVAQEKGWL